VVAEIGVQTFTGDEHGPFAATILLRFDLTGFDIVLEMLANPDLVIALKMDMPIGNDFARGLIDHNGISRQNGSAVSYEDTVGSGEDFRFNRVIDAPLPVWRVGLDFPGRFLLCQQRTNQQLTPKQGNENGAQWCHPGAQT
jgi:hypothetical protein